MRTLRRIRTALLLRTLLHDRHLQQLDDVPLRDVSAVQAELERWLAPALEARRGLIDERHRVAFRLFNGFYEGLPALAADVYGRTLVLHDYADSPEGDEAVARACADWTAQRLPWLRAALWKVRRGRDSEARNGRMIFGQPADLDRRVEENGVWYALALTMNRDASLYLDTRNLRAWAKANLAGARVLNTFAYTGSLGVAARAAPASRVVHLDLNRSFLNVAKDSYALNGFPVKRADFLAGNFFDQIAALRREGALFDCVLLDAPFFSDTRHGRVDLEATPERLLNKVRPLVADGGWLVAVNNALFLSGADYWKALEQLGADGHVAIEATIPVPEDFTGAPGTRQAGPPVDPAPFNHPTKIAVLRVHRKDRRR